MKKRYRLSKLDEPFSRNLHFRPKSAILNMTSFSSTCIFLNGIFINVKSSLSSFQKSIGLLPFHFPLARYEHLKLQKSADSAEIAYFRHFEGSFLANRKSKGSKSIHFWKLDNEDLTLKKITFENMQMEENYVIFKMADFGLKMQISRERFIQSIPFLNPQIALY